MSKQNHVLHPGLSISCLQWLNERLLSEVQRDLHDIKMSRLGLTDGVIQAEACAGMTGVWPITDYGRCLSDQRC